MYQQLAVAGEHVRELSDLETPLHCRATPFRYIDPASIPTRQFLFGRHAIRKFISATVAAGGTGKTALALAEQLAYVTGRPLLGEDIRQPGKAWYIGLEDPLEEYQRRVMAICLHHDLKPGELNDRFFLDSGRDQNFIIAQQDRGAVLIARPVVESLKEQIARHEISLVTIDPFIASHTVNENDNGAIEAVVREWASIADETGAAVELVHHVRKMNPGQEITADDARGARAMVDKARSVRLLSGMTDAQAAAAGVDNRRRYFQVTVGKANLVLPPDQATWRELASVSLGNGGDGPSDIVGVAIPWKMPGALDGVTGRDVEAVIERMRNGDWRADSQARQWAGKAVAEVLGLDESDPAAREKIKGMLKTWIKTGALKIATKRDEKSRSDRNFIVPGE